MLTELFETAPVSDESFPPWFASLASALLNTVDFVVNGESHRFAELEAYYHGPGHPDIFAHRDPLQLERGRWYFHRTGGEYRGGSFKGLDLTFGDGSTHFGILIRSIIDPDGKLVGGPSLTVDRILADTGMGDVATLDCAIGTRTVWDASSPLSICTCDSVRTAAVYATSRVGLSLKRSGTRPEAQKYVGRQYRFLTEPRGISKGKVHLVIALHRQGETPEAIHRLTGCPRRTIERYVQDYLAGQSAANVEEFVGKDLPTTELCRLLGAWSSRYKQS